MATRNLETRAPEIVFGDTLEITSGNVADMAPYATDTAATPPSGATVGDMPNDRQEALWAALVANPGASATVIGAAAGMSRMAAGKILNQLVAEGRARRETGGYDGTGRGRTPDRWYPAVTDTASLVEQDHGEGDLRAVQDDATVIPVQPADEVISDDSAPTSAETEDAQETAASTVSPQSDMEMPQAVREEPGVAEPEGTPAPGDGQVAAQDQESGEGEDAPAADMDPAREQARTELLELAELFIGAATAIGEGEEAVLALGRLEMAIARAPQVHRSARAVLTGTTPARPSGRGEGVAAGSSIRHGALRDRVLEHLNEYPGKEFTPYEIGRALDSSSGAVANALDRLVSLDQAELTCERPRRFRLASTSPTF
ncbi:hypothetical protein HCN51_44495 [Nonomuraea sp. FMUSA5-5]|uniref:MarR family transcriptional regulator n=1 Tax=Nonomuraea composti TaxID=2720023 RepID=A0ABX1BJD0_9ACTN|nr:hypothetical protein [Nonomuraea sp. FMUSA5-5]NJP96417.1 hypothetical protein [Nonomuraea sp. FMUSA5-5]